MYLEAPQLGEGIHHMRVVRILKKTDEIVEEDENLLEVETDKMTLEIPSPVSGKVIALYCAENEQVSVGSKLLHIEERIASQKPIIVESNQKTISPFSGPQSSSHQNKILLPREQISLARNLTISQQIVVPASIECSLEWRYVESIRNYFRQYSDCRPPSTTGILAWATVYAMHAFPKFRMRCSQDLEISQTETARLGIAIGLSKDRLATVTLEAQEAYDLDCLSRSLHAEIASCRQSERVEPVEYHSVMLSDMSASGITRGVPVVVYPSVATLCVGAPVSDAHGTKNSLCTLSFDHRLINGLYAASFLKHMVKILKRKAIELISIKEQAREI